MSMTTDYLDLDVARYLNSDNLNSRGRSIARTVKSKSWFNKDATEFDFRVMSSLVARLEESNRRNFYPHWEKFRDYAESHNIWINEN